MIRNPLTYSNQYDINAAKYLKAWDRYTTNMEEGVYTYENSFLPFLFMYAGYSIDIKNTKSKIANNCLDKIIVEI